MMLGVLINFDQFICEFFQNFVESSLSNPLTVILRENQADSMESQFLGYLEISQSIRKSKVLMSKTRKTTFEEFCHFLFFRERGIKMPLLGNGKYTE